MYKSQSLKLLCSVCLISIVYITCSPSKKLTDTNNKKQVYLFAGQSNMDGRADGALLSEKNLARLNAVADRIEFYYNHKPVTTLQLTEPAKHIQKKFQLDKAFGPELFFGIELAEKYPEKEFIFIKRSKGGTSLYGCWNPDWSEAKAALMNEEHVPPLFMDFIHYTQEVLADYQVNEYEIKGMLWVQGETDSGVKKWGVIPSQTYGDNLSQLIEKTRSLLKVHDMPFVIFQVGHGDVVKGMKKVSDNDKHVFLIPQSKNANSPNYYERNPPPIGHYTHKSMKKIGTEFFKVFDKIES